MAFPCRLLPHSVLLTTWASSLRLQEFTATPYLCTSCRGLIVCQREKLCLEPHFRPWVTRAIALRYGKYNPFVASDVFLFDTAKTGSVRFLSLWWQAAAVDSRSFGMTSTTCCKLCSTPFTGRSKKRCTTSCPKVSSWNHGSLFSHYIWIIGLPTYRRWEPVPLHEILLPMSSLSRDCPFLKHATIFVPPLW